MAMTPLEFESKFDHDREENGDRGERPYTADSSINSSSSNSTSSSEASFGSPLHRRGIRQRMGSSTNEMEEEEFEEALGLLSSPLPNHTDFEEETPQGRQNSAQAWVWWIITMVLVAITSHIVYHKEQEWMALQQQQDDRFPPHYECPVLPGNRHDSQKKKNLDDKVWRGDSEEYTYKQLKENLREWTLTNIAPYILDQVADETTTTAGSTTTGKPHQVSILESSSHTLGLGLFLTLHLLEDMQSSRPNPTQFWVSGHDQNPSPSSFSSFRDEKRMKKLANVHLGVFCGVEESPLMNLSYIPPETFDVVYSDHIPFLSNPLDFVVPPETLFTTYLDLCTSEEHDGQGTILRESAQEKQEALLARWLEDLLRVLRPGGLVIVENVAVPLCESSKPEVGVRRDWWTTFSQSHGDQLSIDQATTILGEDHLRNWRYHVVMRKKDKS